MDVSALNNEFQGMDIHLIDQILKNRFVPHSKVLDAGFGKGRNLFWFLNNGFDVFGIEQNKSALKELQKQVIELEIDPAKFSLNDLEKLPYENNDYGIIICNAVLHFAKNHNHFYQMFSELVRVLKPKGTLFIRMTSNIGIEDKLGNDDDGVFLIPDGTQRYLLNPKILESLIEKHQLKFVEPLKTVNVNNLRCMTTLVLSK